MYNENKANLLKDVLSPAVVGVAAAVHLVIVILFCVMGSPSDKEVEENPNPAVGEQVAETNKIDQVSSDVATDKKDSPKEDVSKKEVKPQPVPKAAVKEETEPKKRVTREEKKDDSPPKKVVKKAAKKSRPAKVRRVTNPVAKKRVPSSSDIKRGQFKKGPLKKR